MLFPDPDPNRPGLLEKYRNDPTMLATLDHIWRVQHALNREVSKWQTPSTGTMPEVLAMLKARTTNPDAMPTPYDYRHHARRVAQDLFFKVADDYKDTPELITADCLEGDFTTAERLTFWRCVAICSAAWEEPKP
jgi:hypothetical protein